VCKAAGIRWDNHESLEDAPSTMIKFDAPGTKCTPYTCTHTQTYTGGTHTQQVVHIHRWYTYKNIHRWYACKAAGHRLEDWTPNNDVDSVKGKGSSDTAHSAVQHASTQKNIE
jgi:hypothetical protein